MDAIDLLAAELESHISTLQQAFVECCSALIIIAEHAIVFPKHGKKVLMGFNRFHLNRPKLSRFAITTDSSILTCLRKLFTLDFIFFAKRRREFSLVRLWWVSMPATSRQTCLMA